MIRLESVEKTYRSEFLRRRRPVLCDLTCRVARGETYALLGANGAGKTTAMKILLDLIRPDRGRVFLDGIVASNRRARARVGFLPEHPYFFPHLTGEELVRYYGRLSCLTAAQASAAADRWLDAVRLGHARSRPIRTYSKGMLQRLGFAQALVADPDLLVLDEPLSGLDPIGRKEMRDLLAGLKGAGKTILLSSHILEDVEKLCDRAGFLVGGRIGREVEGRETHYFEVAAEGVDLEASWAGDLAAARIVREGERVFIALCREEDVRRLGERLRAEGGRIVRVEKRRESLEELFVENVAGPEREREPV